MDMNFVLHLQISNNAGELYSLSLRSPHFNWVQDLSSFDKNFTVTPGNNGRLYVTVPPLSLVLTLDVLKGNILWQTSIGPLGSAECEPVVDSNGKSVVFLFSFYIKLKSCSNCYIIVLI
jgi:hypothetical protein